MTNFQHIKNYIKYMTRKYLDYDLSVIQIKLDEDFLDQKKFFATKPAKVIFDVGANAAQTTHKYRKMFRHAHIYGFEPYPVMFSEYIKSTRGDKRVTPVNIALSDKNGFAKFFVNIFHGSNSLLPSNDEYTHDKQAYQNVKTIEVKTETLDNFSKRNNIEKIDILKMDVQGGELSILQGSEYMLTHKKIDLIYTEVMFAEIYKDQPLFNDIKNFLEKFGYKEYKTYNIGYEKDGKPISGDVTFI